MQIKQLFDLLNDAQDLLEFFEGVEDANQLASRLNRLKQGSAPSDLLDNLQALRVSTTEAFEAQIELGGLLSDGADTNDAINNDLLSDFPSLEDEKQNDSEGQEGANSSPPASERPSS